MRSGAATLALLAALSVLLQPVCAANEMRAGAPHVPAVVFVDDAAHGTDDRAPCGPEVEAGALVAPLSAGIAKAVFAAGAAISPTYAAVPRAAVYSHARQAPSGPPPSFLRYYARSARIQR